MQSQRIIITYTISQSINTQCHQPQLNADLITQPGVSQGFMDDNTIMTNFSSWQRSRVFDKACMLTEWIVMGECNLIFRATDKNNNRVNRRLMSSFKGILDELDLNEGDKMYMVKRNSKSNINKN